MKPRRQRFHCPVCGGTVSTFARAGRTDTYKGIELAVPAELELTECEQCGETYVDPDEWRALSDALALAYREFVKKRLDADFRKIKRAGVSLASLERQLALSEGYLSKIRKDVEPSFQLVALVSLVAENPRKSLSTIGALKRTQTHSD
jgi:YgiT-type zinc finger domain-containing protein